MSQGTRGISYPEGESPDLVTRHVFVAAARTVRAIALLVSGRIECLLNRILVYLTLIWLLNTCYKDRLFPCYDATSRVQEATSETKCVF